MHIQFNGQSIVLLQGFTLEAFLKDHGIDQQRGGIAVALNGRIVLRVDWPSIKIQAGDQIEVVHAVSGG